MTERVNKWKWAIAGPVPIHTPIEDSFIFVRVYAHHHIVYCMYDCIFSTHDYNICIYRLTDQISQTTHIYMCIHTVWISFPNTLYGMWIGMYWWYMMRACTVIVVELLSNLSFEIRNWSSDRDILLNHCIYDVCARLSGRVYIFLHLHLDFIFFDLQDKENIIWILAPKCQKQ